MIPDSSPGSIGISDEKVSHLPQYFREHEAGKIRVPVQGKKRQLQFGELKAFGE
jgi:hypothetical protein